jgi:V/A-type H+-transporting ATPase subunit I
MPAKMRKIRIISMRKDVPRLIAALHENGLVDFRDVNADFLEKDAPLEAFENISSQLVRIRALRAALPTGPAPKPKAMRLSEAMAKAESIRIDDEVRELQKRREEAAKRAAEVNETIKTLDEIKGLNIDFAELKSSKLSFYLGKISAERMPRLQEAFGKITRNYNIVSYLSKKEYICLLAVDGTADARKAFAQSGFVELPFPKITGKAKDALSALQQEKARLADDVKKIDAKLKEISTHHYAELALLEEALSIEADRAEKTSQFSRTKSVSVLEGWIEADQYKKLEAMLKSVLNSSYVVQDVADSEPPPTKLKNPGALSPFEFLVEFFSLPQSGEIDPTFILAFTFPLIYGMMLGDVGYGLVSLIIALIIIMKTKGMLRAVGKLWAFAAIPAMIFGVIYDEWFGFTHQHILEMLGFGESMSLPLYPGLHRMENIATLLVITIFLGMAQLALAFVLGAINNWHHSKKHAIAKLAWIGIEAGGFVLITTLMFPVLPQSYMPYGAAVFALAFVLIIWGEGVMGLMELPGFVGNILSYTRIVSVGVASVVVAELLNEYLFPNPSMGLWMFLVIPVYAGIHLFNICLGMFESIVQGGRLNLVEFFSKFYKGGGKKFAPFRAERIYTKSAE